MSANYLATQHSSLKTPFWASLSTTPNLKFAIAQAFPDDNVPEPTLDTTAAQQTGEALYHSKLLAVKGLFASTVQERNTKLKSSDILRFRAIHTLGMVCVELGQWVEAEKVFNILIVEADKALGPDSKPAMGAISTLGNVYEHLGKHAEAEITLRRSLELLGSTYGKESPQYLGSLRRLIPILAAQKKFDEAEQFLEEGSGLVAQMNGDFKVEETQAMKETAEKYKGMKNT